MEILIPKPDSWYLIFPSGILVCETNILGPFHDSGDPWESVTIPESELNAFSQGARLFGESSVYHQKVDGKIYVNPGLRNLQPSGTTNSYTGLPEYKVTVRDSRGYKRTLTTTVELLLSGRESGSNRILGTPQCILARREGQKFSSYDVTRSSTRVTTPSGKKEYSWSGISNHFVVSRTNEDTCWYYVNIGSGYSTHYGVDGTVSEGLALAEENFGFGRPLTNRESSSKKYYLDEDGFSISFIKEWLKRQLRKEIFQSMPSSNLDSWGDLTHAATANLDALSSNMIAFLLDLKDIKSLIPKLSGLAKLKTHADNYLSYQYGVLPTIDDLKSIFEAFRSKKFYDRSGFRRVSAYDSANDAFSFEGRDVPFRHTRRIHIAVNDRDTGLDALVEKARSIGVFPSLTNLWDLLPYSFVIDWFTDVGSVLERIDTRHRLLNLDIPYVIMSDKIEFSHSITDTKSGLGLDVAVSYYNRFVTTVVPQPRIFGEINKPPTVQNHWIEGSALIIQRTK